MYSHLFNCLSAIDVSFSYLAKQVPEESQLIYRAPASSLECCCFISNDEFLSGSDDGSIEQWSVLRKKPVHIVRNAHALQTPDKLEQSGNGLLNGHIGENQLLFQ